MKREDLIDVVLSSHSEGYRKKTVLYKIDKKYKYLVAKNKNNEGIFIIWEGPDSIGELNFDAYQEILNEAKKENLLTKYNVYARYEVYQSENIVFYKITDKILAHLGLNEYSDSYNEEKEDVLV